MNISLKKVSADYIAGPVRSPLILQKISTTIPTGSFTAIIGHTGSGKSSLLKMLNGLLLPKTGTVTIGENIIKNKEHKPTLKNIRKKVGMVFQFPEAQLFAETVEEDILFGPLNFGIPLSKAKELAMHALIRVGLDDSILTKSPFSLSGGEKRRVAIAGILVMNPDILVLDEPGAGLDPQGRKEILELLFSWHKQKGSTTLFVTHDMDDVVKYADEVIVIDHGRIAKKGSPRDIFSDEKKVNEWKLGLPESLRFQLQFERENGILLSKICLTLDELADCLAEEQYNQMNNTPIEGSAGCF